MTIWQHYRNRYTPSLTESQLQLLDTADLLQPGYNTDWNLIQYPNVCFGNWLLNIKTSGLIKLTEMWAIQARTTDRNSGY